MWERFSYYGMRALLVGYLTKYLLLPGHVEHVLFYPQVKAFFEMLAGPLNGAALSSLIYGTYTGLIYATPLLGGWLADNLSGPAQDRDDRHRADGLRPFHDGVGGAAVSRAAAADFRRRLFQDQHHGPGRHAVSRRRCRGATAPIPIFYVGINLGAFLAPLVCGTLGEEVGWHYGFAAAGVGMLFALVDVSGRLAAPAAGQAERRRTKARAPATDRGRNGNRSAR